MLKRTSFYFFSVAVASFMVFTSCEEDRGANPYDPNTPVTVSQMPKIESFAPAEGEAGTEVHIFGVNFLTATAVSFGGKAASSFEIISDTEIAAVVSEYGGSGNVAVTNHKGTKTLAGFLFVKPQVDDNPNLALGKRVYASSENTPAANVTDGTDALWQGKGADHEWIVIDFGKMVKSNHVIISWDPGACATSFEILVSEDNENFTSVYSTTEYDGGNDGITDIRYPEVAARYLKIDMTKDINIWNYTIKEVEVYMTKDDEPEQKVNFALGKSVTTSSDNTPGANLTDGTSALWQAGGADYEWCVVDLGESKTFNNVMLEWDPGACAVEFEIQISENGEDFTTVYDANDYNPSFDGGVFNAIFNEVTARYVKVDMTKDINVWNYTIKELEVYKLPSAKNLALERPVTASSELTPGANLTDGTDALWQANGADNEWCYIDLGESVEINSVLFVWDPGACATAYEILVSDDATEFVSVYSTALYSPAADGGYNYVCFSPVHARYVKVNMTQDINIWNYTIKEFEIYKQQL